MDGEDKLMASVKSIFNIYARILINTVSLSTKIIFNIYARISIDAVSLSTKSIFNIYARISINAVSLSTISLIALQESHALVIAVTAVWNMLFVYDRNINEMSDVLFIT